MVHGGADQPSQKRVQGRKEGVKEAAMIGYKILKKGGSVADAVEAAVKYMEDNVNFNAGIITNFYLTDSLFNLYLQAMALF